MSGTETTGPFGPARKVLSVLVADILAAYRRKCGADVSRCFADLSVVDLYECQVTGYRFWRPLSIAAGEETYRLLSAAWPNYYHSERWEYKFVRKLFRKTDRVLEVGCGRGYFLRSIEPFVRDAVGLEFNSEAVVNKVTKFAVRRQSVEDYAVQTPGEMDVVCGFQILEHVANPCSFIKASVACLRPGGLLVLSTPNMDCEMLKNREDAFDLPPHHIGHFSERAYRAIAQNLGLEVVRVRMERRRSQATDTISPYTKNNVLYRKAKSLSFRTLNVVYWLLREPGNNILVIFRKPA